MKALASLGKVAQGKSTFVNLILRLYEADEGRINIWRTDIRKFDIKNSEKKFLCSSISYSF